MNDFDRRFKKKSDDFDRDFNRAGKLVIVAFVVNALIVIGILAFSVWVIVSILQYFGIV